MKQHKAVQNKLFHVKHVRKEKKMKVYVIFRVAKFECDVDGKHYNPIRAMAGIFEGNKCVAIKLLKCDSGFTPPLDKRMHVYFDENGKAVSYKLAD